MSRTDLYSFAHADCVGVCKSQFRGFSLTARREEGRKSSHKYIFRLFRRWECEIDRNRKYNLIPP